MLWRIFQRTCSLWVCGLTVLKRTGAMKRVGLAPACIDWVCSWYRSDLRVRIFCMVRSWI